MQSGYKVELIESITEIRKQASRIKEEADQCLAWAVHDSNLAIKDVKETTGMTNDLLKAMQRFLEERIPLRSQHDGAWIQHSNTDTKGLMSEQYRRLKP